MLSKEQKEKLRNIHIYELACEEKNGVAIIRKSVPKVKRGKETFSTVEEEFVIPSPYQISESILIRFWFVAFQKLKEFLTTMPIASLGFFKNSTTNMNLIKFSICMELTAL